MNSKLFLFTVNYPFGTGEVFIENEIGFLADTFNEVIVMPLFEPSKYALRNVPGNVKVISPLINCNDNHKIKLLLKGVFNTSSFRFALQEFFKKRVWTNRQWVLNWLSSTCLARAGLSSKRLKSVLDDVAENDIFYFYWADNSANMLPVLRKRFKNKVVARFHNTDIYEENKGGYLPYRNIVLPEFDLLVFIANDGKNYLNQKYPGILKKQIVSKLGVFDRGLSFHSKDNTLHLVSCSAINNQKRVHLIPQALRNLDFRVKWTHLGDGPLRNSIENEISNLPENIKVTLLGQVDNRSVLEYYRNNPVDLFINVSKNEGIPVAIMEASSMGIPTLATNVGGVAEIVNEANGILMPADIIPAGIAGKISWFFKEADKESMRQNARILWDDNYNAEKNFPEFCCIISQLAD